MSTFSFSDHFVPILHACLTCLPCLSHSRSNSSHADNSQDYFPDSAQAPLLPYPDRQLAPADLISLHSNNRTHHNINEDYDHLFGVPGTLSTWQLISSWISSKFLSSQSFSTPGSPDLLPSSLLTRRPSESDARILDDLSFLVSPELPSNKANPVRLELVSPELVTPMTSSDEELRREEQMLAEIEEKEYMLARRRAKKKAKALGLHVTSSSSSSSTSTHIPSPSEPLRKTPRPYLPSLTSSNEASEDCELFSNPTTVRSSDTEASATHPSSLAPEIVHSIRQTYGADARELYGRELSLVQVEQIYNYISTLKLPPHPSKNVDPENNPSRTAPDRFSSPCRPIADHAKLATNELLEALKSTKRNSPLAPQRLTPQQVEGGPPRFLSETSSSLNIATLLADSIDKSAKALASDQDREHRHRSWDEHGKTVAWKETRDGEFSASP